MSTRRFRVAGLTALVLGALLTALAPTASAAQLTEVTGFGSNPSNLRMHLYVPDTVVSKPPVLVAVHYCTGTGPAFYSGTEFARMADRYGFIVIYPSATRSGQCFDVSSPQALKHDGGSDPVGIVSMVRYVLQRHNGDANRVYVTGASSGAMMTNVLLGAYPDVFKAGAAFAGVPFGCFATTDGSGWNSTCAQGNLIKTAQQWGDLVRAAYPGYTGPRPRMQIWHGTADDTLRYPNFGEQIKQWTNVNGLSQSPTTTDSPQPSWTRTRYFLGGDARVEAISIQGGTHNTLVSGMAQYVMDYFALSGPQPPPPPPPGSGTCRITYATSAWNTGLTANITIANTGTTAISGWSLGFTLPAGQTITSGWSATYSPASGAVTAKNLAYNPVIAPGSSIGIGLQATHTGDAGKPASFTLNGTTCAVA
ncbi:poly(hydroxyalkanoate) depolymerase family esterase [Kibdelosporangium banguiense]|uniref:Poly(Hydroxyalkanoate) depolymerase family esterase n=1 Tax=Kibdelosporangium banguiense TaxID=1365924 RepID=A0ABS4TR24_9PSEU|nr:PHB depolymerase family esterase [Kibdelosporangium banguiense]MBP2326856.1 poly(hydroxyalkanoate) depolymerase family esterase [Kibdelosporangium banguiense]